MSEVFDKSNNIDDIIVTADRTEHAVRILANHQTHTEQEIQEAIAFLASVRQVDVWGDVKP